MRKSMQNTFMDYEKCILCPRECGVDRRKTVGVCRSTSTLRLARAALHFWEEPCISGKSGSGAVFFCGCNMHCVFCQNEEIAKGLSGMEIDEHRLVEIFLELQEQGANNINLVTAGHYLPQVIWAVEHAKNQGLSIPIVYNTGSYEKEESIKKLEGIVDIYLPDFKYMNPDVSEKYSHARDYADIARKAIAEMVRQQPEAVFYKKETQGEEKEGETELLMKNGVIVRHLLLPGQLGDSKKILKELYSTYKNQIYYSLMSQFTPLANVEKYQELQRRVTKEAYEALVEYALRLGIENGFTQEREVAKDSFIPHFDCEGVEKHKK